MARPPTWPVCRADSRARNWASRLVSCRMAGPGVFHARRRSAGLGPGTGKRYPYGGGPMSTLGTIAVIVGVVVVLALVAIALIGARRKRLDSRREEAGELRQDAQRQGRLANRQRAEADERAARAKKAEAEAEERAAAARRERALAEQRDSVASRQERFARDRHEEARSVDPDVDDESEDHEHSAADRSR